jgi:hypothetical protein
MKRELEAAGDVRSVDLLAAFVSIWREGRSGSVRFTRSGSSAGFDFTDGELVAAFSSDVRFETGAILVRAGKLDGAALEQLAVPPGTDGALAALQAGILTRREWKWGEKIRAIEILAELLGWPDGKYLYDAEARPARTDFGLAIPRLLLELFLRSRDRHLVDHQLGPTDVALVRSERFDDEFATFGLTADAESVVRLIDGQATASEICDRAPAEEFAVLKLLAALKTLGLLEHRESAAAVPEDQSPPEEPEIVRETEEPDDESDSVLEQDEESLLPDGDQEIPPSRLDLPSGDSDRDDDAFGQRAEDVSPDRGLDVEVGDVAPAWESASAEREWRTPADDLERELDTTIDPPPPTEKTSRNRGLLWILLGILVAAVGATVLVRSRRGPAQIPVAGIQTPARPTRPPTRVPATAAVPAAAVVATPRPSASPVPSPTRVSSRAATARAEKPTPAPTGTAGRGESARAEWLARARSDRRKLDADRWTRYAIQLELACEVPSLVEAWKHDRPAGSMWLLAVPRGGRDCFRVLWGRFPSIEAARKAKSGIPPFFTTTTNHPAVVAVR